MGERRTLLAASDLNEVAKALEALDEAMAQTSFRVKVGVLEYRGEAAFDLGDQHLVTVAWDAGLGDQHYLRLRSPADTLLDVAEELTAEADGGTIGAQLGKETAEDVTKEENCWCGGWCPPPEVTKSAVCNGASVNATGARTSGGVA